MLQYHEQVTKQLQNRAGKQKVIYSLKYKHPKRVQTRAIISKRSTQGVGSAALYAGWLISIDTAQEKRLSLLCKSGAGMYKVLWMTNTTTALKKKQRKEWKISNMLLWKGNGCSGGRDTTTSNVKLAHLNWAGPWQGLWSISFRKSLCQDAMWKMKKCQIKWYFRRIKDEQIFCKKQLWF